MKDEEYHTTLNMDMFVITKSNWDICLIDPDSIIQVFLFLIYIYIYISQKEEMIITTLDQRKNNSIMI